MEWEKMYANYVSDKELYPEHIKNSQQLNNFKKANLKIGKGHEETFLLRYTKNI